VNTPAHLIFGTAAFGKPGNARVTIAAVLGSLAPDISLYVMVSWSIFVAGINPNVVFGEYYYSSTWQQVFAVDNSFVLWGLGLGLAMGARRPAFIAFASAGLLHLAFNFPVHNHDARMHFWPLSDWVFVSPISYWERLFHAGIVSPIELMLALGFVGVLFYRFRRISSRALIIIAAALEILATRAFSWFF